MNHNIRQEYNKIMGIKPSPTKQETVQNLILLLPLLLILPPLIWFFTTYYITNPNFITPHLTLGGDYDASISLANNLISALGLIILFSLIAILGTVLIITLRLLIEPNDK